MFVIPAIVIAIIFLLLKILVPTIILVSLVVLLCIYYKNRGGGGEGDQQEQLNINLTSAKEKVTNAWKIIKIVSNFINSNQKKDEKEGKELEEK